MPITAAQWRQIVDSAIDTAIISTDRNGQVTSWNNRAVQILGYLESEMLGPLSLKFDRVRVRGAASWCTKKSRAEGVRAGLLEARRGRLWGA